MAEKGCKQCGACKGFASRTPTGKFCSSCGHPKSNHFGLDDEPAASPPAAAAAPAPVPVNAINAEASAKADAEKAEADRLAAGKAAAEKEAAEKAEADRLAAESAAKAAADREAAEKAEADRLAAEKEAAEKAEADRLVAENAAKAAAEKEAAEKAEADRLVAESAAKAAADRAETLKEAADNDDLKKAAAENTEADRLSVTMPDIIEAEKAEAEKTSPAPTTGESAASNESAEKDSKNDNSSEKNADVASSTSTEEPKSMSKRGSLFANAKNDAPPEPTGEAHPPIDPSAKQTPAVAPSGTTPKYMGKSTSSAEVASSAAASSGGGPVVGMSLKERMALLSKSGSSMGSGPVGGPPPGTSPKRLSAPSFLGVRTDSIADGKTDDARLASEESEPPRKSVKELMKGAKLPSFGPPPGSPGGPPVFGFGMPRPPGSFAKAPEEDRKLTHNNLDRPTMVEKRNSTGRKRAGSSNAGRRASFDEDGVDGLVEPISAKEEEKKMASTL